MSAFGRLLPIEAVRQTSALSCTIFILWLDQRHALKAFRATVGDVEGHSASKLYLKTYFISPCRIYQLAVYLDLVMESGP